MKKFLNIKIYLFLIILLAIFLRFWSLGSIPSGLTNDEANVGYDAYSILLTGHDQWGQFLPIFNFKGFGDYRPALFTYLVVPSLIIFDLNEFSVRFPSALFGVISVILLFTLLKYLFDRNTALIGAFLLTISPWAIGLSRVGIESNIAITLLLLALNIFVRFKKNPKYLPLSIFIFSLAIYAYTSYIVFIPLLIFVLVLFYRHGIIFYKKEMIFSAVLLVIFIALPFLLNNRSTANVRFSQVGLTNNINSIGLISDLNNQIGSCLTSYPKIACKITDNKLNVFAAAFFKNYFNHFSVSFLYLEGITSQFSILPKRGLEYIFEIPLLFLGIFYILKKNIKNGLLLLAIFLISPIPDALTSEGHYSRASVMLPFMISLESLGFIFLFKSIKKINIILLKYLFLLTIGLIIFFSVMIFFVNYSTYFRDYYSSQSQYGYKELMTDVFSKKDNFEKIYITRYLNDTNQYVYYLFYNKYDPYKFQNKVNVHFTQKSGGWIYTDKIDNIYFVDNLSSVPLQPFNKNSNILLVSHPLSFPKEIKAEKDIKDKLGNTIFKEVKWEKLSKYLYNNEIIKQ